MSEETWLLADHVVIGDGVLDEAYVGVRGGLITAIVPRDSGSGAGQVDPRVAEADNRRLEGWLVPGFVDTHNHGGGGADFATTDPDEVRRAVAFHRAHGTTATLASLVTAAPETYDEQLATLAPLVAAGELAGVHLEGPFLSPEQPGAHDPPLLAGPSPEA